ncbi:unnamed protein product [Coffea canephora]|uniref:DH200=94 genomic scaffold, scaffold_292 n=1 Tax=Coffea canephora TaxID=49390 RepID=A0A068VDC5_COFCA|nr:unnamed protein product [Coffea canephora]
MYFNGGFGCSSREVGKWVAFRWYRRLIQVKKSLKGPLLLVRLRSARLQIFQQLFCELGPGRFYKLSRYEGDLVARCYFAKHKLVREVRDGGLKKLGPIYVH